MKGSLLMFHGKKVKKAVALYYQQEKDRAPVVLSSGKGLLAKKIIALAKEHNIPVKENPSLAESLYKINPGQEITPDLYEAVAIILTSIIELDNQLSKGYDDQL